VERYVGVTLLITGVLLILAAGRRQSWKAAASFCAVSGSLLVAWLVRNTLCTSTLMGARERSQTSLVHNAAAAAQVVSSWFLPRFVPSLVVIALILALSFTGKRWVRPAALFAAVYFVWIVASCSLVLLDEIDDRLLSPLYLPIVFILLGQEHRLLRMATPLLLIIIPITSTTKDVRAAVAHGAGGYASDAWTRSGVIGYLRSHPLSGAVYTNEPAATYLFLGRSFQELPPGAPGDSSVYDRMKEDADVQPTFLVWYQDGYDYVADRDDVLELFDAEIVTSQDDGTVYRLRARSDE
jgi:hypothetical protein